MEPRRAREADVPAVVALVTRTLAEFGITFGVGAPTDAQLQALPASYESAGGAFFVVEEGGAIVGTAGIFPKGEATFELRKMYLDGAVRGRGVGQRLFEVCLAFARERGARHIVLDTTERMKGAIAFYEQRGFVRDDAQITATRCSRGYRLDL
jgi:putative acetyltransferase